MDRDPFYQAWFTSNEGNCYLDKAWRALQWLLGAEGADDVRARTAAALVSGRVIMTPEGWIPHVGVLDPDQLGEASRDLDRAMPTLLGELSRSRAVGGRWYLDDIEYVRQYLEVLQRFAAEQARAGRGMVYMIG